MIETTVDIVAETAADVAALIPRYSWELMDERQRDDLMVGIVLPRYRKTTSDGVRMGPKWWAGLVGATENSVQKRIERLRAKGKTDDKFPSLPCEWTEEERTLQASLLEGLTVVVNLAGHQDLIAWAEQEGLFVRIDRKSAWGNPFILDDDGDRDTVIANYREHYLPHKPSLKWRLLDLQGKALGCWCAPEPCHGDVLIEAIEAIRPWRLPSEAK
jgi:hypothetical protein